MDGVNSVFIPEDLYVRSTNGHFGRVARKLDSLA